MLSLNTASRTCRDGDETARPQIRQVATFVEDSHCSNKLKYAARLSHALTWGIVT
jgi:hypothetical protein